MRLHQTRHPRRDPRPSHTPTPHCSHLALQTHLRPTPHCSHPACPTHLHSHPNPPLPARLSPPSVDHTHLRLHWLRHCDRDLRQHADVETEE
eukprot:365210-Chlamydomonas_euryale.AAC.9